MDAHTKRLITETIRVIVNDSVKMNDGLNPELFIPKKSVKELYKVFNIDDNMYARQVLYAKLRYLINDNMESFLLYNITVDRNSGVPFYNETPISLDVSN